MGHDEGEQKNLAAEMPDRTAEMLEALLKMEEEQGNLREKGRKALERRLAKQKN